MSTLPKVYAVIMAGGFGTRFWPASRSDRPKQLLALGGNPEESLLAATVRRLDPLIVAENVFIATGTRLLDGTAREVPRVPRAQILAEPVARNTAPCIGWATATIARRDPEALIAVLPSDHFIVDEAGFRSTIERALEGARAGYLTTIGVVPTRPDTGYGYIEVGAPIGAASQDMFAVERFVEKPDRARAETYVAGKKHLWNAGMFFFKASTMMEAIHEHMPALGEGLAKIDAAAAAGREDAELASVFPTLPSVSIDVGVMEKARRLAVVKGDFGWNDVGSWESAWELAAKDGNGNALPAGGIAVDAAGNLVRDLTSTSPAKLVALVGVNDLVVVETDDALLVMPRSRAQDVRAIVDELKARGDTKRL
ncbi:MAG: Mannose-phosphate guanylyltransferase [Myxococcaceae bacterium]|nr:Mannose-phosphate guanylyltransferase [Myxococcaceae bacterium]